MPSRALLLLSLLAGLLAAGASVRAAERARPVVLTTNTILADMTREIAGDAIEVQCLVPAGVDLHGFDPTPRDIAPLLEADLVVANGAGFEPWLDRFLAASGYAESSSTAARAAAKRIGSPPWAGGRSSRRRHSASSGGLLSGADPCTHRATADPTAAPSLGRPATPISAAPRRHAV